MVGAINNCNKQLGHWNKRNRIGLRDNIYRYQRELHKVSKDIQAGSLSDIHDIKNKLESLLVEEEVYWR